jgi:hypothetical protein
MIHRRIYSDFQTVIPTDAEFIKNYDGYKECYAYQKSSVSLKALLWRFLIDCLGIFWVSPGEMCKLLLIKAGREWLIPGIWWTPIASRISNTYQYHSNIIISRELVTYFRRSSSNKWFHIKFHLLITTCIDLLFQF